MTDDLTPEELELAQRGQALISAAVVQERAPLALRERIEDDRRRAPAVGWRVLAPVAGGLAALIVAVVIIAGGGGVHAPTVSAVAGLSLRGVAETPPAEASSEPELLQATIDGISFPYWQDAFKWTASGQRTDTIGGRRALTVFYDDPTGARIGYSIVGGHALAEPSGRVVVRNGVKITVLKDGARQVVTWRRADHTCVINAPATVATDRLVRLASWKAAGAVRY